MNINDAIKNSNKNNREMMQFIVKDLENVIGVKDATNGDVLDFILEFTNDEVKDDARRLIKLKKEMAGTAMYNNFGVGVTMAKKGQKGYTKVANVANFYKEMLVKYIVCPTAQFTMALIYYFQLNGDDFDSIFNNAFYAYCSLSSGKEYKDNDKFEFAPPEFIK